MSLMPALAERAWRITRRGQAGCGRLGWQLERGQHIQSKWRYTTATPELYGCHGLMKQRIPPTHCLLAFEALARHRNAAIAAEDLCITPSALSYRLRQLELMAGTPLFDGRDYALSEVGQKYLTVVRDALDNLRTLPEVTGSPGLRKLRLAVTPTFAREILMPKLPLFRVQHPDIDLVIQVAIPLRNITEEDCDLEIRYGTGHYTDTEHTCIMRDHITPVASPEYARDTGPFHDFTTRQEIERVRLIRSPLEPWGTWFSAFGIELREPPDGAQFNDVGLMLDAAAAGYGVTLLRTRLGGRWLSGAGLVRLSAQTIGSPYQHDLCWQPGAMKRWECSSFFNWLVGVLRTGE